ncbi:MAG: hypothetical protein Crog4KO_06650 [Crocinitomicaceae bacterium]
MIDTIHKNNPKLISASEIRLILGYDTEAAEREHAHIRKSLGTNSPFLLIKQFCEFHSLIYKEISHFLRSIRESDSVIDENVVNEEHSQDEWMSELIEHYGSITDY